MNHDPWQDVEQVLQQEPDLHVLKILIADAKAADAARIAALEQQLTALPTTAAWQDVKPMPVALDNDTAYYRVADVERARAADAQQIAALAKELETERRVLIKATDEIAALKDEVEHQKVEVTRAVLRYTVKGYTAGENADSKAWRERAEDAEQQIAALRADNAEMAAQLMHRTGLEAQLTALQAEQAQWQQFMQRAEPLLAALTALQEKPQP